ncbi:MAG: PrsW family intramembrane metalloprotease [Erysipelotrichaceae bacterium]|nr:PrsW family intramembrane metalloprotease [Erysipelotrichaceae bacterium]
MVLIIALILSFIPSILMFFFLRNNRKNDEEYKKDCTRLLFQGIAICGVVMLLGALFRIPWNLSGIAKDKPMLDRLFVCFVVNAFCEETAKFLFARKYFMKNREKTSRLDIISFLTISAISFALLEDIVYVFGTNIAQIIIRGVLMGHVPNQLMMGQLYGKGIAEKKPVFRFLGFIVPMLMHGLYNFLLTPDLPEWTAFVEIGLVASEFIYMIRMIFFIRKKRNDPEFTRPVFH